MRLKNQIEYEWLGVQKYSQSLNIQETYHKKRVTGHINDSVIFLEHYPVITIGRTGSNKDILSDSKLLEQSKAESFFLRPKSPEGLAFISGELLC